MKPRHSWWLGVASFVLLVLVGLAQYLATRPEAALKNVKWYPAVPAGIEDIEGRVLDRIKAAQ